MWPDDLNAGFPRNEIPGQKSFWDDSLPEYMGVPKGTYDTWKKGYLKAGRKVQYSDEYIDTWYKVSQKNIQVVLTPKGLEYRWV